MNLKFSEFMMDSSEMTAFCESDKKRILDSLTAEDLTIFKEAFTVYDKGWKGIHFIKTLYWFYSENDLSLGILLIWINLIPRGNNYWRPNLPFKNNDGTITTKVKWNLIFYIENVGIKFILRPPLWSDISMWGIAKSE